jgi:hypothetical protein
MRCAVTYGVQADATDPSAVDTQQAADAVIEELRKQIVEA